MSSTHEALYNHLKNILEKNIDAQKRYLKTAEIAKQDDIQSFFKQKAHNKSLFNDKLMFELNYAFNTPQIDGSFSDGLNNSWMDTNSTLIEATDASLLLESLKDDKIALQDYEELLKNSTLPLSLRFIIKEQVTIIKLDELKMDRLINLYN